MHPFSQVDVFSTEPLRGNPVAVVHLTDVPEGAVSDEQMAAFARWTNLSETTFVLPPTDPAADYRLRIFTPGAELPFAGHPTLGSAHAWLERGGLPRDPAVVVQECGAGLVRVHRDGGLLSFEAPPLVRSGPVEAADLGPVLAALGLAPDQVVDAAWIDNGPGWLGVLVADADTVLALRPDHAALGQDVGVVGPREVAGADGTACEVRAFCPPEQGIFEDPVTGSLNAGIGMWLAGTRLPASYVAAQGTVLGRAGRVHVSSGPDGVRVGGATRTVLSGTVSLA